MMHVLRRLFFRTNLPILPLASSRQPRTLTRYFRTTTPRLITRSHSSTLPPDATVSQRLKHLVKSYGWYALGVYLVFSALDFSVAFVGIKLLGADQVSQAATYVKQAVWGFLYRSPEPGRDEGDDSTAVANGSHEGLYAMIVLAYTIHKTLFLPIRVGLTAAFTPRIVGWLRARGWAGGAGEGAKQAAREMKERIRITKDRD